MTVVLIMAENHVLLSKGRREAEGFDLTDVQIQANWSAEDAQTSATPVHGGRNANPVLLFKTAAAPHPAGHASLVASFRPVRSLRER